MCERHYYRCAVCLSVGASGDYNPRGECGVCGGDLEHMGRVTAEKPDRLTSSQLVCKCDDRCVFARGPKCDCPCGGKNHGAGMLGGFTFVTRDRGPVPVLSMQNSSKAAQRAAEYRAAMESLAVELERLSVKLGGSRERDSGDISRFYKLRSAASKARKSRVHLVRMAALCEVLPEFELPQAATAQASLF